MGRLYIGTAGWSIPRDQAVGFPGTEAHLVRYSDVMRCAEINSSFYRPHRAATYSRWAASTPEGFRFSVKVPKAITHECGLAPGRARIESFLEEVKPLGTKLGPLLLQLPPKQAFAPAHARRFLSMLRVAAADAEMVIEPRHSGWFTTEAGELLREFQVARVMADPPRAKAEAEEEQGMRLAYYRLHGSPRMYYSSYSPEYLERLAERLRLRASAGEEVWCIFDNTASGAALENALRLARLG